MTAPTFATRTLLPARAGTSYHPRDCFSWNGQSFPLASAGRIAVRAIAHSRRQQSKVRVYANLDLPVPKIAPMPVFGAKKPIPVLVAPQIFMGTLRCAACNGFCAFTIYAPATMLDWVTFKAGVYGTVKKTGANYIEVQIARADMAQARQRLREVLANPNAIEIHMARAA